VAADASRTPLLFDPTAFQTFCFQDRELREDGLVTLGYRLGDELFFQERFQLPVPDRLDEGERARAQGLLSLLHWVAGVSYFKLAAPPRVEFDGPPPPPAVAALLEALYSEGLGEFAYTNRLAHLPRPRFSRAADGGGLAGAGAADPGPAGGRPRRPAVEPRRVLVPVGGGKDSAVAIEIVRRSGLPNTLFSIGDAPPIARTVAAAGLPWLVARRTLDPELARLNESGALNGHVPVTAIVTAAALLCASLNGYDAVAMANERSASSGNLSWDGVEVNHQFSKGLRVERLLDDALQELDAPVRSFSVLRPASELAIARAFARLDAYHDAFTSCNAVFRLDPQLRGASWCCDCPKCRFVFLALAPFTEPEQLREIFGRDLLDEEHQFEGFALLCASGGHKPFECVGEEQESLAAIRLLAGQPRWSAHRVVRRLVEEVLPRHEGQEGDPARVLELSGEHEVPGTLMADVRALLGA
jgi:UDP-N-acetyl-alpha-D-muramoyl-L-alanyl-L-glutamate epimerase